MLLFLYEYSWTDADKAVCRVPIHRRNHRWYCRVERVVLMVIFMYGYGKPKKGQFKRPVSAVQFR